MKKYDVIRHELVEVTTNRRGLEICEDTKELCYSVRVLTDFLHMSEGKFRDTYGVTPKTYRWIRDSLPAVLEPIINDRVAYKDENRIVDISKLDEGIPLNELNISKEDKAAIKRARASKKLDYEF